MSENYFDLVPVEFSEDFDFGSFDLSDEAEALASIGWGTDEDYYPINEESSFPDSFWE